MVIVCMCLVSLPRNARTQVKGLFIQSVIKFDGLLTEKFWESVEPVSDFTQRELVEGAPPTEKTEVRIAFDSNNLYIGVICYDSEPDKIIHKQMKPDALIDSDDRISFGIDTYCDRRMGYLFSVNPNGMRYDATFRNGQTVENIDWDGIWDVRSRITEYGWSCEIIIPFKTLRFPAADTQLWGFNIKRTIRRKNEEVHWRGWHRDDHFFQLSKYGTLSLDRQLKSTLQLEFKPYLLTGAEKREKQNLDDTFKYGLDVKYGITSNSTLDLTTRTDFAQIESDREVINLTRFSLFYPEKRDFFLEGSDTFDFTQGGTRLFYSRRIGISPDREEIPILGGIKLTQKSGGYRLGILSIKTEDAHGIPGTNYSVVRVKKDIFEQSYIGFIGTSVSDNEHHDNQVYGMDFIYRTDKFVRNKNFEVQGYLSASLTDGKGYDNLAGRLYICYPNDLINTYILHHVIDDNFKPEIGYVKRTGLRNTIWLFDLEPRPGIPFIKKLLFRPVEYNYTTDMNSTLLTRTVDIRPFGFQTNSGDELRLSMKNEYDYVDTTFTIFNRIRITPDTYNWWYTSLELDSSTRRAVSLGLDFQTGDYYTGERTMYDSELTFRTNRFYQVSADFRYNRITIGDYHVHTREYGGRLELEFSTRLSSSTFVQWNNETNEVNVNFRIHYIPKIGSDLYLVYNHLMDERDDLRTLQNTGMLKLDFTYRL